MVDFTKMLKERKEENKVNPIDIYDTLDRKSITGPLRSSQKFILENWFKENRESRDSIIKLDTGQGKTLIGLLILQSLLNTKEGPCLYVAPNKYLVEQVCKEAEKFGIGYCVFKESGEIPEEFLSGEKILITHAHKVFNGLSVFGIGNKKGDIGAILLDDSHTCIDVIKDAYTVVINKKNNKDLYHEFLYLFEDTLKNQREGSLLDLKNNEGNVIMNVPYWSWSNKKSEVLTLLSKNKNDDEVKFTWPLIKDHLEYYSCFVAKDKIEISCDFPSVKSFPVFSRAPKRILMSATTQDDAFCIKGLDFSIDTVKKPLKYEKQKWSGEKMVLIPSLISDNLDRNLIVTQFSKMNQTNFGMVSITPNTYLSNQYQELGGIVTDSTNIFKEIEKLKKKDFEKILIINNRYDGIDLPDEACRVLILDSLPFFTSLSDKYEEEARATNEIVNKKMAQKIEQGLGRAVRGEKDYCINLIIGAGLVNFIKNPKTQKYFSNQTKKQIEIGLDISKEVKKEQTDFSMKDLYQLMAQSFNRDEGWKYFYQEKMNEIKDSDTSLELYNRLQKEKEIQDLYIAREYQKACKELQFYIDNLKTDEFDKSWYKQLLAKFYYDIDPKKSNELQIAAFKSNQQLLKPKDGISYEMVSYINQSKINRIKSYLKKFDSYEDFKLSMNDIIENLSFGAKAEKFENALQDIGALLGFISDRPDKSLGTGPDNLWCGTEDEFFLFECKNEVKKDRPTINKHEVGQMNNHCAWFEKVYGTEKIVNRFLIIPTKNLPYHADFTHEVKIIRERGLNRLRKNVKRFIDNLHKYHLSEIDEVTLEELLEEHHLNIKYLRNEYCEEYKNQ
ncbi:DEAD/DEAH box helicase family protein [Staphylococcus epidermidis]|uniref:DEAD/DEAH box helicase family protein n=1 Tax=Staphylococcus TaxID=1279 RepID=UPI0008A955D9|nr:MULTISPECIES: DEAD/DEAH box helicase family protein [Staphylococcus]KAB2277884.1 DEAD/DEAH box helicase [Staphylococcus epidermidis]MBC3076889.1 DEAD/DEAH box helicase family protein [Staphylococcus epidermidis]MBM6048792.1 DEAD/DEAH box helicase family protein [Staphylococcus epidermidis]MCG2184715.1 DEAD/DEAH box helicase family protein [Staphylococcus epidermidis]MCO6226094.1 DEAD/DEAH box helicase family protein [Staphylococcus epidermidis]